MKTSDFLYRIPNGGQFDFYGQNPYGDQITWFWTQSISVPGMAGTSKMVQVLALDLDEGIRQIGLGQVVSEKSEAEGEIKSMHLVIDDPNFHGPISIIAKGRPGRGYWKMSASPNAASTEPRAAV